MEIFRLVFSPIEVNTYILADKSGDCAIIDCGCYTGSEFESLVKLIDSKRLKPVLLLNTHCHLDHVFGNRKVLEKYGLRSHFHIEEEFNRLDSPEHAKLFGLSMEDVPEAESFIAHGDLIRFGSTVLKSLFVPGHTSGSLAFYLETDGCVFTGDALFAGSIGRTDLPGGNYETLITSIRQNLLTLPPATVIYPGHGPETSVDREKHANPFLS